MSLLQIKNLCVTFNNKVQGVKKSIPILHNISFEVEKGQCIGILGESGSGKSITAKAILGVLDQNFDISGSIMFNGTDLLTQNKDTVRKMRGKHITMILQNPMVCFDSLYRIEYQIAETLTEHTEWSKETIYQKSLDILEKMQIKDPKEVLKKYPHQLSGGMLQRIMIGIAIMLEPDIIIADEPTTAIDSITQYNIMQEFKKLKNNKTTMIFITHDLTIASYISDKILVLKNGHKLDFGTVQEVMETPKDQYTQDLINNKKLLFDQYLSITRGIIYD